MARYFLSKMNPETFEAISSEGQIEIPNPKKKEATPTPQPGDIVFFWVNGQGLVLEAAISHVDPQHRPVIVIQSPLFYGDPKLGPSWLESRKGRAAEPIDELRKRVGAARTETGGTILMTWQDVQALDAARREMHALSARGDI